MTKIFTQPAKAFEEATGCTGIAANYRMPEGETAESIGKKLGAHPFHAKEREFMLAGFHGQNQFEQEGYPERLKAQHEQLLALGEELQKNPGNAELEARHARQYGELYSAIASAPENRAHFSEDDHRSLLHLRADREEAFRKVHKQLVALNPELVVLDVSTFGGLNAIVMGAISQYNTDDIASFIAGKPRHPLVKRLYEKYIDVEPHKVPKGWIMSDATALKVIEQLHPNLANHSADYRNAKEAVHPSGWDKK